MTTDLNLEKKEKVLNLFQNIFTEDAVTIRFLSKLIWNSVAGVPAVIQGLLYYRALEMDKTKSLQQSSGNFDASIRLPNEAKKELCWCITNITYSLQHNHVSDPDIIIYTDSSLLGWGVTDGNNLWKQQRRNQIRVLKLKLNCNWIAKELMWCTSQNMWLSTICFPRKKMLTQAVFPETSMRLLTENWRLFVSQYFKYVWKSFFLFERPFCLPHKSPVW